MPPSPTNTVLDFLTSARLLPSAQVAELPTLHGQLPQPKSLAQELVRRRWLTPFQATTILQGHGPELFLGPYVLLDKLGQGGYGQVFKARHQKLDRLVAIKVLRPELVKDGETVQRFYREIEVVSQLSHPNIVHAFEAGPLGNRLVLVLEHVEGQDLEAMVQQLGCLPPVQACDFIRQAAVGLQYAHEKGLIHRDIKPSNLLVGSPGRSTDSSHEGSGWRNVKILDLGLARLQQPVRGSTTSHLTVLGSQTMTQGSPDYLSPEQALDFHSADIRSDIYSLGCTLFFLLAGTPPFAGGTLAEKLLKHQQTEPPLHLLPDPAAAVRAVVGKMLAKRSLDRYQTPAEVVEALRPFCSPGPARSETATLAEDTQWLQATLPDVPPQANFVWQLLGKRSWMILSCLILGLIAMLSLPWLLSNKPAEKATEPTEVSAPVVTERVFLEKNGRVVMEAENFTRQVAGKGSAQKHAWVETTKLRGYSGTAAIIALPNTEANMGLTTDGPRADYRIRFAQPGTYHVWVRMLGASGVDDSIHVGLNDKLVTGQVYGLSLGGNVWGWIDRIAGKRVLVAVPEPGVHTFHLWMREDGTAVDKFVLTLDAAFKPTGLGPDESHTEQGP